MEEMSYKFPSSDLLIKTNEISKINYDTEKSRIEKFFQNYKINIECVEVYETVNVTTYVIDVKNNRVSKIKNYKEDLILNFNVIDIEFKIAINKTNYLGIQMIKLKEKKLCLGNLISSKEFIETNKKVPIILGKDFNNNNIIEDLTKLPHLLIAGTTGTGKSNYLSSFIVDIIYKLNPSEYKLALIDTRGTNFNRFNGIPHLLVPVINESRKSLGLLMFLIEEMNKRYSVFKQKEVDDIDSYNKVSPEKLPRIIVIIEDFADLMINTKNEIEEYIRKLIQISGAAGINIIISTQRPSTNVITGLIKSNIPARISFKVPSQFDSRTIIDEKGAEDLLIYGDILFKKIGLQEVKRIQTPYISDFEIESIINNVKVNNEEISSSVNFFEKENTKEDYYYDDEDEIDPLLEEAIKIVEEYNMASTSLIQRTLKVGYARAGRIIDQLEYRGIISGYLGSKPRKVLKNTKEPISDEINNLNKELNDDEIKNNGISEKWWFWLISGIILLFIILNGNY